MRHRCHRRLNQPGLERSLIRSLALTPSGIITTVTKAKFLRSLFEKCVTIAKHHSKNPGNVSYLRRLISKTDQEVAKKLIYIATKVGDSGGYCRIIKLSSPRFGDLVKTACISVCGFENTMTAQASKE